MVGRTLQRMERRIASSFVMLAVTGLLVVSATFLPWVHTGSRARTSYDLLGLLDRLDLAGGSAASALITLWPMVPLLIALAVVLGWWGHRGWSLVVAGLAALYVLGVATLLVVTGRSTGVDLGIGVASAVITATLFLASAVLALRSTSDPGR